MTVTPKEELTRRHREVNIQRTAQKCRHFNGMRHDNCEAGIAYMSLPKELFGSKNCVCFGESSGCAKFEATGMDAAKKRWEDIDISHTNYLKARGAISAKHGKERGIQGSIPCPVCGTGQLNYSISKYNGHCHARCTTDKCVRWME